MAQLQDPIATMAKVATVAALLLGSGCLDSLTVYGPGYGFRLDVTVIVRDSFDDRPIPGAEGRVCGTPTRSLVPSSWCSEDEVTDAFGRLRITSTLFFEYCPLEVSVRADGYESELAPVRCRSGPQEVVVVLDAER